MGGFILITNGVEIIASMNGWQKYIVTIGVLFMAFGIIGKAIEDIENKKVGR